MARQAINIGTTANDGTGDTIRSSFDKSNDNFLELYNRPYVIGFFAGGAFDAGEVFFKHTVKENATFTFYDDDGQSAPLPDPGTAPSFTVEDADPTTTRVFSITVNGVEVGTVTFISTDTVGSASFTAGSFEVGIDDVIRIVAPSPVGTSIQGMSVTLLGFRG